MSINARMNQNDPRLYNPSRDVAHNFDQVIMEVATRIEKGTWDILKELAKEKNITDEELGKACQALCRFVAYDPDKGESMAVCLAKCGFLDLSSVARVIVTSYLGTVMLGMHWGGVRETTINGVGPVLTYKQLRWHGMRCAKLMTMPRWKRKLYVFWSRLNKAWRVFWQKDYYG